MKPRDPHFDSYTLKIYDSLDRLDYYKLLGVDQNSGVTDIRNAFLAIAAQFHPDRNRNADETVQKALYDIFKRLNEAYRVLCDPEKREAYNKELAAGKTRLERDVRKKAAPIRPEETIKSVKARQFYQMAQDALRLGNVMKADLHIKLASSMEKNNPAIESFIAEIQAAKQKK